nr:hypothetical protein [Xanthomonas axonopodis]
MLYRDAQGIVWIGTDRGVDAAPARALFERMRQRLADIEVNA